MGSAQPESMKEGSYCSSQLETRHSYTPSTEVLHWVHGVPPDMCECILFQAVPCLVHSWCLTHVRSKALMTPESQT